MTAAEEVPVPEMESSNSDGSSYKDVPFPVQRSSPPSLPPSSSASELAAITTDTLTTTTDTTAIATTTTDGDHPSAHHTPFSTRPHSLLTPTRTRSSLITPPPSSTRPKSFPLLAATPGKAKLEQYDWRSILLTPPPTAKRSDSRTSSYTPAKEGRDHPALSKRGTPPIHVFHYRPDRNDAWPKSPTLSIKRARKHSQQDQQHASLRVAAKRTKMNGEVRTTFASSSSSLAPLDSIVHREGNKEVSPATEPTLASTASHKMLPPFKPRALTLDGIDRPTLPPMLGYPPSPHTNGNGRGHAHSQSLVGPIRNSPSSIFTSFRNGPEYRSNPYFISAPARWSVDHARSTPSLSPVSTREASYFDTWTPVHTSSSTPWTPTSSVRSTSSGVYQHDVFASSYVLSRASLSTPPLHLDHSSPNGPPSKRSESNELPAVPDIPPMAFSYHRYQQQQRAEVPNNALGLYMEAAPFPSELLRLNLGHGAHHHHPHQPRGGGSWTPRSETDSYFRPNASDQHPSVHSGPPYSFTRSPASMSDLSPQTPSPPSGEDILPKLSLGHRHGLDTNLALPTLLRPIATVSSQRLRSRGTPKQADNDFLYKMPVLRAMPPLADMSSDSEDEEEPDHSIAASSSLTTLSDSQASAASGSKAEGKRVDLPEEGCTGEVFRQMKSQLPITFKHGGRDGAKEEQLFCKLDSTTHQCFSVVDGKWACYRRNYLKIDVAFHFEDASGKRRDNVTGDLILQSSPNSRQPTPFIIDHFAVHISAHVLEPTSGKLQRGRQGTIPLIQFGPARERGAREPVQPATLRAGGNITKDATGNEQASARTGNIAAFRRVQIRSATMNNGQRGAAGQQFYALKLTLLAYARGNSDGMEVANLVSEPITVRGRSKAHYAPLNGTGEEGGVRKEEKRKEVSAPAGPRNRARSVPTVPSVRSSTSSIRSNSTSSRRRPHAGASHKKESEYEQNRRSTRLLLAANNSGSNTIADADNESEADNEDVCSSSNDSGSRSKVMDIRSVL